MEWIGAPGPSPGVEPERGDRRVTDYISHQDLIRNEAEFERRRDHRAHRYMLVSYRPEGEADRAQLTVSMDVSCDGMSIWTKRPLRKDTVLELSICHPGSLEIYRAQARVCWSRPATAGAGVKTGLRVFASTPPK